MVLCIVGGVDFGYNLVYCIVFGVGIVFEYFDDFCLFGV